MQILDILPPLLELPNSPEQRLIRVHLSFAVSNYAY
jgi:hypothetical protein